MILRRALLPAVAGALGVALVVAALLTGCVREEEAEDSVQGVEQATTPTPEFVPFATVLPPTSQPTVDPAVTPVPLTPTVVGPTPFVTPTATPPLTPTPQPGACPVPYRTTPEDFVDAPLPGPVSEPPGRRMQGGVPYSEGYLTVDLPAGRDFVTFGYWSDDHSSLVISIYDVQAESGLEIWGDGCERGRFVRDAAADAAFDDMISGLEVGSKYVCPVAMRYTPENLPVPDKPPTQDELQQAGPVQGGVPVQLGPMTLHLPAGREFVLGSGTLFGVTDVQTLSGVSLRADGCEISRMVRDPAADKILDEIVATLQASTR